MLKKIFITTLLLIFNFIIFAQESIDVQKLNKYLQTLEENDKFMGSVSITQNGEIIYQNTVGFLDIKTKEIATKDTKYRVGSITKTFTAALVLKAQELDKLSLNQTLDKWFPQFENAHKITIQDLLAHRSGIPNITNEPIIYYGTRNQFLKLS